MAEITSLELDSIRSEQETFLPDLVIIRRRAYIGDDFFDFRNIATDVPCRLTPGLGFWRTVADKFQGITPYRATVAWTQDLKAGDTIIDAASRVYEVRDVQAPSSYQTAKQALCDLVTDG
jgi:hypothetical protein